MCRTNFTVNWSIWFRSWSSSKFASWMTHTETWKSWGGVDAVVLAAEAKRYGRPARESDEFSARSGKFYSHEFHELHVIVCTSEMHVYVYTLPCLYIQCICICWIIVCVLCIRMSIYCCVYVHLYICTYVYIFLVCVKHVCPPWRCIHKRLSKSQTACTGQITTRNLTGCVHLRYASTRLHYTICIIYFYIYVEIVRFSSNSTLHSWWLLREK